MVELKTLKYADAVILMQQNFNYQLLFPRSVNWESFEKKAPMQPFSDEIVELLNALSSSLLKDKESRLYPDVITFAFFCRKANLLANKAKFVKDNELRLGRGTIFHIAPSNVPINFAYSLVAGLLSGNRNIVRISSKEFAQVDMVIKHLKQIALDDRFASISENIVLVRYDRDSDATAFFSQIAAVRVIWGGDNTISTIRNSKIPPRSFDVCFADRYSIAAIKPEAILQADDNELNKLAEKFYNDTYLFDQNACSAPHLIFWVTSNALKDSVAEAKERFWKAVHSYTATKYNLQAVLSVDKLTAFYSQAIKMDVSLEKMPDNYIIRTDLKELPLDIDTFRCAGGYFSEMDICDLSEITPIVTTKYQTLAYYGFSTTELNEFVISNRLKGIDRIVPFGETTSFSLIWDGYNLIETLSRIVSII